MIIVVTLIVGLILFATWFVIRLVDTLRNGLAPDIGTPNEILPDIYKALALKPTSVMFELGCGDARVLRYCAQKQPKAQFVGVENGILQFTKAKWRSRKLNNVTIKFGDFRKADLTQATHFYLYLLPEALALIDTKFPQKSRIVTCQFPLVNKKARSTLNLGLTHPLAQKLYIY